MLALNLKPGQFLAVGDALFQIVSRGSFHEHLPLRIAVEAPQSARIIRFDRDGNPIGFAARVVASEVVPNGFRLHLKCGHVLVHPEKPESIVCHQCWNEAEPVLAKVKALAAKLQGTPEVPA